MAANEPIERMVFKNGSVLFFHSDARANAAIHGIVDKLWMIEGPPEMIDCKLSCVDFLRAQEADNANG